MDGVAGLVAVVLVLGAVLLFIGFLTAHAGVVFLVVIGLCVLGFGYNGFRHAYLDWKQRRDQQVRRRETREQLDQEYRHKAREVAKRSQGDIEKER
jgi:Tfp pilus assembly protein PilO